MNQNLDLTEPADEQDIPLRCINRESPHPAEIIPTPFENQYVGAARAFIQSASKKDLKSRYPAEYNSHRAMLQREKEGAIVHDDFRDFRTFLLCVGPMPKAGHTLDRIDNHDPEYAPGKVRWATKKVQNNNKSDNLTYVCSLTGKIFTTSQLAQHLNVKPDTIRRRKTRYDWSDDEIIRGQKFPLASEPSSVAPTVTQSTVKTVDDDKKNAYAVGEQWKNTVAARCGTPEFMPPHKDISRAKGVISELGHEKVTRIISSVVPCWRRFSMFVKEHDGLTQHFPIPRHPNFRFVFCDHPQAAVNFAFDKNQQLQMEQERERETMLIEYRRAHGFDTSVTPAGLELQKWWKEEKARQRAEFAQKL